MKASPLPAEERPSYWRKLSKQRQYIISKLDIRITQLEADYDLVETELRELIETCKCERTGHVES